MLPRGPELAAAPVAAEQTLASQIRFIRTAGPGRLEISGWAFRRTPGEPVNPETISLVAVGPAGTTTQTFTAAMVADDEVNRSDIDRTADRSGAGFSALIDLAALVSAGPPADHRWRIEVAVDDRHGTRREPFVTVAAFGSAAVAPAVALSHGVIATLATDEREGLVVLLQHPDVWAGQVGLKADLLWVRIRHSPRFRPERATLVQRAGARLDGSPEEGREIPLRLDPSRGQIELPLAGLRSLGGAADGRWTIEVRDVFGHRRGLRWAPPASSEDVIGPGRGVLSSAQGQLRLDWGAEAVSVLDAAVLARGASDAPGRLRLVIAGLPSRTDPGGDPGSDPGLFWLQGERQRICADRVRDDPDGTVVEFALRGRAPFSEVVVALSSGRYRLLLDRRLLAEDQKHPTGFVSAGVGRRLGARLGERTELDRLSVRIERSGRGEFAIRIAAPRLREGTGRFRMRQLARACQETTAPLTEAVLFDCFDGKSIGDSPAAIRSELMSRRPDLDEYWVVADHSVPVPEGATPVIWFSRDHFEARARARFVVTNCWLGADFHRRPDQRVLQTWHGTPLKRLGFDRIGVDESADYRAELIEQTSQWTWLISQNPYSTEIFRRAYGYGDKSGELAETGYPRNDVLSSGLSPEQLEEARSRIGLRPGERAVLFAPTWREDVRRMVASLDLSRLLKRLGPSYRILVRGHANTLRSSEDVRKSGVIDVTTYPVLTDLFAVAEVLITDYSSMMFDFSITGKPMVFFVPDLAAYAETLRGVYFDLSEAAPGPLTASTDQVAKAVQEAADGVPARYADAYRAWVARFNPFDDGQAARRAVDLLLGEPG